jgi:hypothetical protein
MDLFATSGMDLPSGGGRGMQKRLPLRLPHVPLFNQKTVEKALAAAGIQLDDIAKKAADYAKKARSEAFRDAKETAARPTFYSDILQDVLGYKGVRDGEYSLEYEYPLRRKPVDAALGRFGSGDADFVHAPFEMKGPRDAPDLDKIVAGRGMSPVQQAWDYAADAPNAKWVLVSNCLEIRLYAFGRGRDTYELFDLTKLDDPNQLRRLVLILGSWRFLDGLTEGLLAASDSALKTITNVLYKDYQKLRVDLVTYLVDAADGPKFPLQKAIEAAQKLLDRALFIAFASGNSMLPKKLFSDALSQTNPFDPKPKWHYARTVFRWVDKGNSVSNPNYDVWPYNGGLFALDPDIDAIDLPDHLADAVNGLFVWDYGEDVSVNVLGHIFEHSIGDLEQLRSGAALEVSQRKKEGVVYTPEHVTSFIVDQTIGKTLKERFAEHFFSKTGKPLPLDASFDGIEHDTEQAVWLGYLASLRSLTIVDPACGSGAFLVAAFDALLAEYRRVTERLFDLGAPQDFDIADEILLKNLHGVDLNVESVEITRLALWLKSARRHHRLAKLDQSIQAGNSLISDAKAAPRPFDWDGAFPEIMAQGGFDIVIGNPPYVRMEHLKDVKPWLAEHYTVADERTDLSAYFFEKGVRLLKKGGRLGYISTSSFFRAGYGEKLRLLLGEQTDIETVIDYGDVQIFEGVTTYPAIVTARKKPAIGLPQGELEYLTIKTEAPEDLGRTFLLAGKTMPRARLTGGSWQFEDEALARLRDKITKGRRTLGEVYGAPLYGIKTGLNDAFIIDNETRDRLVALDPNSAELLKPFLKGENIKRWRVEPEGLWLINTPRGKVDIERYPAIRDWLLPFKDRLEARATQQEWWELQQAQLAYHAPLAAPKIVWPHFQLSAAFSLDRTGQFLNNKCFFFPSEDAKLLAFLNSNLCWWTLTAISRIKRGGYIEAEAQYVEILPFPDLESRPAIAHAAILAYELTDRVMEVSHAFLARLPDLGGTGAKISRKLEHFHKLDFAAFRNEVKRALNAEIPVKERGQWEAFHADASSEIGRLTTEIEQSKREIDAIVYEAFNLTPNEISLLEKSLEDQF